jgi:hypothetical protein
MQHLVGVGHRLRPDGKGRNKKDYGQQQFHGLFPIHTIHPASSRVKLTEPFLATRIARKKSAIES